MKGMGHSSWRASYKGDIISFGNNTVCYAGLQKYLDKKIDEFIVYYDEDCFKQKDWMYDYISFIINDEEWSGLAFLTKDVEEGLNKGFKLNCEISRHYVFCMISQLRIPFEMSCNKHYNYFSYPDFRKMGYGPRESICLMRTFTIYEDEVYFNILGDNHTPFQKYSTIKQYYKEAFKHDLSYSSFIEPPEDVYRMSIYSNFENKVCTKPLDNIFSNYKTKRYCELYNYKNKGVCLEDFIPIAEEYFGCVLENKENLKCVA